MLMRLLLALLLLAPGMAWGQAANSVLACDTPRAGAWAGCNSCTGLAWADRTRNPSVASPQRQGWTPFSELAPTDQVYVSSAPAGSYGSCDTSRPVTVASLTGTVAPPPPPPVPPPLPPPALIREQPIAFPSIAAPRGRMIRIPANLVQNGETWLGIWSAQSPTQLYTYMRTFGLDEFLPWLAGEKTDTAAEFAVNPGRVIPPGALTDWMHARRFENQWRVVVSVNGTTPSRPVFARLSTGLRSTTAATNARVAVGAACRWSRLADSAGKATAFHSVQGLPNVATADPADALGDLYALCTVTPPAYGSVN